MAFITTQKYAARASVFNLSSSVISSLNLEFELVPHTPDVVPDDERAVGCLVGDQLAVVLTAPVLLPVQGQPGVAEAIHAAAVQLPLRPHLQVRGELPEVFRPVLRLLRTFPAPRLPALNAPVDDVRGQTKAQPQPPDLVLGARAPVTLDNAQHRGFRRLRRGEEPDGGGEVEPGVAHKVRVVKEDPDVPIHGGGERAVVVVV